jgi:hypothetical protein
MLLAAGLLVAVLAPGRGEESPPAGEGAPVYELKIYKVWASSGEEKKLPKELEKFARQLRKFSRKKTFRLDEKPFAATLQDGKPVTLKLPDGYEGRWTLQAHERGKPAILQALVNPKKEVSQTLLMKSPVLTEIRKLEKGGEAFFLVVEFEPAGAKKKG